MRRSVVRGFCIQAGSEIRAILMNENWRHRIESDPAVLRGKPCIKETRIPVALILGYVACGRSIADICREFPDLSAEAVTACLFYARDR
jgi:uncharacterized protein (DUF433 family)